MNENKIKNQESLFLSYQEKWLLDENDLIIANWARQVGKDYVTSFKVVMDILQKENEDHWIIVSAKEQQAITSLNNCKKWLKELRRIFKEKERYVYNELDDKMDKIREICFPNNSTITAMVANPSTIRGVTANIWLNEFAHFERDDLVWEAVLPIASNNKKIIITSTPFGKKNLFYNFWQAKDIGSKHETNIYQAREAGLKRDIAKLKLLMQSQTSFSQEFMCQFIDGATAWLSLDLINSCIVDYYPHYQDGKVCISLDIARSGHLFAMAILEKNKEELQLLDLQTSEDIEFEQQHFLVEKVFSRYPNACLILDKTGMGEPEYEFYSKKYGEDRVEGFVFTNTSKHNIASELKASFQQKSIKISKIYNENDFLLNDLHSISSVITKSKVVKLEGNYKNSHGDIFWSLAMGNHVLSGEIEKFEYETVDKGVDVTQIPC